MGTRNLLIFLSHRYHSLIVFALTPFGLLGSQRATGIFSFEVAYSSPSFVRVLNIAKSVYFLMILTFYALFPRSLRCYDR